MEQKDNEIIKGGISPSGKPCALLPDATYNEEKEETSPQPEGGFVPLLGKNLPALPKDTLFVDQSRFGKSSINTAPPNPVAKRICLLENGHYVPERFRTAIEEVREYTLQYANNLKRIFDDCGTGVDVGRAIASIDHLKQTRDIAIDAITLPHIFPGDKNVVVTDHLIRGELNK